MGADLICMALRLPKDGEPDFDKVRAKIESVDLATLDKAYGNAISESWAESVDLEEGQQPDQPGTLIESAGWPGVFYSAEAERGLRDFFREGVVKLAELYEGQRTESCLFQWPDGVRVPFFGGVTWGDPPFDEWDNVAALSVSGILSEIGWS